MSSNSNLLKQSLAAIETLQARLDALQRDPREPIAIVGAACRYAGGANDPEALWRLARDGVNAIGTAPAGRGDTMDDPTRRGGFLPELDQFDPRFFGISPREANAIDPQQRLLLETSYEALERAGLAVDALAGSRTGVYVGMTFTDYGELQVAGREDWEVDQYVANGGALAAAAGRISFAFGFEGPSIALDTACSSSLVAVHLAVQSLRAGEINLALAGGVSLMLRPKLTKLLAGLGLMAADDLCKPFDAAADGYVRAEGCGMVALKRLSDAQAAGDPILALIRGSAVNSDGRSSGLSTPHGPSQEAVIRTALENAGLKPADIDGVEAHGTGTAVGDPIEMKALAAVLAAGRPQERPLLVGALKSNIGHAEAASGVASLIKTAMALRHEQFAPTLHFRTPSPNIDWANISVRVPTELTPWPRGPRTRRAGVSAFGFSGTNAHVILEEPPSAAAAVPPARLPPQGALRLIPFSARGEGALRALAARHAEHLAADPSVALDDYVATMGRGRASLPSRLGVIAASSEELQSSLAGYAVGEVSPGVAVGEVRSGQRAKIAFLFTGQGTQYPGMGRGLYRSEPVFCDVVDRCAGLLSGRLERPLTELMGLTSDSPSPENAAALGRTGSAQPALFVFEYALAMLWRSWGVVPQWVAGHGVGEYVAACVAGVFSLEGALDLIVERGRLMQALPSGGTMSAVFASESEVIPYLNADVSVAAVNGPKETVISGPAQAVRDVLAALAAGGFESRPLDVSHAFHSMLLDPMLDEFESGCGRIAADAPRLPLISNLTGKPHPTGVAPDAGYWRRHARGTVRFADSVETLRAAGATVLLELGPHPTLLALAQRAAPEATWALLASVRRGRDDRSEMLGALQALYVRGLNLTWPAGGRRVALPTYPFQRARYWMSPPARGRGHSLLGKPQVSPAAGRQFLATLTGAEAIFQTEQARSGRLQLPFTGFLEIAHAAARASGISGELTVSGLRVERALEMHGREHHLHTALTPDEGGSLLQLRSAPCDASTLEVCWQRHMSALLRKGRPLGENSCPPFEQAALRCSGVFDGDLTTVGPNAAQGVAIRLGGDMAVAEVLPPESPGIESLGCAEAVGVALRLVEMLLGRAQPGLALEPRTAIGFEEAFFTSGSVSRLRLVVCLTATGRQGGVARADLRLETTEGEVAVLVNDVALRATGKGESAVGLPSEQWPLYRLARRWVLARRGPEVLSGRYALLVGTADSMPELGAELSALLGAQGATQVTLECPQGEEPDASAIKAAFGAEPGIVIDCRALGPMAGDPPGAARLVYQRSLNLLQSLGQAGPRVGLCVVTQGALAVTAADVLDLPTTVVPGLLRTAAAEEPTRPILLADLDPGQPPDAESVIELLNAVSLLWPEVAWRGRQPWTPTLATVAADGDPQFPRMPRIREDGTYLVSGGLGGIGLKIAAWLVARHAGGIALLSRQPPSSTQAVTIDELRRSGCRIECVSCDVSDMNSLAALRSGPVATLPPIRGVFHAAGALSDASIANQDGARFDTVARAKLDGSWCLHRFTQDDPLEIMVLFSSVSGTFGAPGQANYAAANTFMDGLAAWRQARGQPALSVGWGPWAADGMAARLSAAQQTRMKRSGMGFLESAAALEAMASIPAAETIVAVLAMAADRVRSHARPGLANLLGGFEHRADTGKSSTGAPPSTSRAGPERSGTLGDALIGELARALGFEPAALDLDAPLSDLGFDSMMAIQLRGSFASRRGVDLPLRMLLQGVSTRALVAMLDEPQADSLMTAATPDPSIASDEVALDEGML